MIGSIDMGQSLFNLSGRTTLNDLEFAVNFAEKSGEKLVQLRSSTYRSKKIDRTDVTGVDISVNDDLILDVERREGPDTSVLGEERSHNGCGRRIWVVDPVDGTGEYVDDAVQDEHRTTCVGVGLLVDWQPVLSVAYNPFRREMFTATRTGPTLLNGRKVRCSNLTPDTGVPYDYAHWSGAAYDLPSLEDPLGKPLGSYSAIYQACMVASGRSTFAAFAGNTLHDVVPAVLLVQQAGGLVTDFRGRELTWQSLTPGVLYASRAAQRYALDALGSL
jgi:fructose-1,6-bisphosphatase/inositol monophosphatase family enzyme